MNIGSYCPVYILVDGNGDAYCPVLSFSVVGIVIHKVLCISVSVVGIVFHTVLCISVSVVGMVIHTALCDPYCPV